MYAAGFYIYSIFALLFWETRRKDFGVMMSHHVATIVLIVMSYICRYVIECNCLLYMYYNTQDGRSLMILLLPNRLSRPGSVILAIHDATDIFLEVGKMAKYSSCEWLAVLAFVLFAASWVLLRLIFFPFWILRSAR
jgi:ceramide synthetase